MCSRLVGCSILCRPSRLQRPQLAGPRQILYPPFGDVCPMMTFRNTPCSRHCHMIDFIITRCRDKMDIHSTRVMRGANCRNRTPVAFRIRQKHNRQGTSKPTKLNTAKLSTTSHREHFDQEMDSALAQWEKKENSTPDEEWAVLQQVVYDTAKTSQRENTRTGSIPRPGAT